MMRVISLIQTKIAWYSLSRNFRTCGKWGGLFNPPSFIGGELMEIGLYNNYSEKNVIEKSIGSLLPLNGNLKDESSITDPVILIEIDTPVSYNYCYIHSFNRYYFIVDIINVRTNLWELYLHVDVLMSFKEDIKKSVAIMESTESENTSTYLDNGIYRTLAKDKTDIISFSSGFNSEGEYILITAGGDS